jgi:hypothetical protein
VADLGILATGCLLFASAFVAAASLRSGVLPARIAGAMSAINTAALQLVVPGIAAQVTPDTTIKIDGTPVDFENLTIGTTVTVCGTLTTKPSRSTASP